MANEGSKTEKRKKGNKALMIIAIAIAVITSTAAFGCIETGGLDIIEFKPKLLSPQFKS
ncbi:MAG TPA: hypothetical protein VMW40_00560 [Candidatus Bathyarchaeia archaeon]|nr:hypothetical protein [Candidatus Bathyarchaeia archaeon]